jgi:hypothetical protein
MHYGNTNVLRVRPMGQFPVAWMDWLQEEIVGVHILHQGLLWDDKGIELLTEKYTRLTPWSRFLLENLIVAQLVKKLPVFYGTRRFITVFTRTGQWIRDCIQFK